MAAYNPNKKIAIEIQQHISPTRGYSVWDVRDADKSRNIIRDTDENGIFAILDSTQYLQFQGGRYKFTVTANTLCNQFGYLY